MELAELGEKISTIEKLLFQTTSTDDEIASHILLIRKLSNRIVVSSHGHKSGHGVYLEDVRKVGETLWNVCVFFAQRDAKLMKYTCQLREISIDLAIYGWGIDIREEMGKVENKGDDIMMDTSMDDSSGGDGKGRKSKFVSEEECMKYIDLVKMFVRTIREFIKCKKVKESFPLFTRGQIFVDRIIENLVGMTTKKNIAKGVKSVFNFLFQKVVTCRLNEQFERALESVKTAEEIIHKYPTSGMMMTLEISKLAIEEFNIAVDFYKKNDYETAQKWLLLSYELMEFEYNHAISAKDEDQNSSKVKSMNVMEFYRNASETLKVLAMCKIQLNKYKEAFEIIEKSLNFASKIRQNLLENFAFYYLKIKILVLMEKDEKAFEESKKLVFTANNEGVNLQLYCKVMRKLTEVFNLSSTISQKNQLFRKGYLLLIGKVGEMTKKEKSASNSSESSSVVDPNFLMWIYSEYIQILLQVKDIGLLETTLNDIVTQKNKNLIILPTSFMKSIHVQLWNLAIKFYDEKKFLNSEKWFLISMDFLTESDKINRAKVLRQITKCRIDLGNYQSALTSIRESMDLVKNMYSLFLLFEIFCCLGDKEKSVKMLMRMKSMEGFDYEYYSLLSQMAYDRGLVDISAYCLEQILFNEPKNEKKDEKEKKTEREKDDVLFGDEEGEVKKQKKMEAGDKGKIIVSLVRIYVDRLKTIRKKEENKTNLSDDSKMNLDSEKSEKDTKETKTEIGSEEGMVKSLLRVMNLCMGIIESEGVIELFEKDYDNYLNWFHIVAWNESQEQLFRLNELGGKERIYGKNKKSIFEMRKRVYDLLSLCTFFLTLLSSSSVGEETKDEKDIGGKLDFSIDEKKVKKKSKKQQLKRFKDLRLLYLVRIYTLIGLYFDKVAISGEFKANEGINLFDGEKSDKEDSKMDNGTNYLDRALKEVVKCRKIERNIVDVELLLEEKEELLIDKKENKEKVEDDGDIKMLDSNDSKNEINLNGIKEKGMDDQNLLFILEFKIQLLLTKHDPTLFQLLNQMKNSVGDEGIDINTIDLVSQLCLKYCPHLEICQASLKECIKVENGILKKIVKQNEKSGSEEGEIINHYSRIIDYFRVLMKYSRSKSEEFDNLQQMLNFLKFFDNLYLENKKHLIVNDQNRNNFTFVLIRSWNNAVYFYKIGKKDNSEKWGGMAVRLCEYVKVFEKMNELTSSVIDNYQNIIT